MVSAILVAGGVAWTCAAGVGWLLAYSGAAASRRQTLLFERELVARAEREARRVMDRRFDKRPLARAA